MTTEEKILDIDRFATLDVLDTASEDDIINTCPSVQIVDSLNEITSQSIEIIKSRVENTLRFDEEINHLYTITLSVDEHNKTQLFR